AAGPTTVAARQRASAAWCGTPSSSARLPNVVAGNPLHWVYVAPSDGQDRLSTVASVMQSGADEIDGCWRGLDSRQTPPNALARFRCGAQLDMPAVRASRSSAEIAPSQIRFLARVDALRRAGLTSPAAKCRVFYDGPGTDDNVCGQ